MLVAVVSFFCHWLMLLPYAALLSTISLIIYLTVFLTPSLTSPSNPLTLLYTYLSRYHPLTILYTYPSRYHAIIRFYTYP